MELRSKNAPTADEFLNKEYYHIVLDSKDTWVNVGDIESAMIEFAQMHVEEALKAKIEAMYGYYDDGGYSLGEIDAFTKNSYPLSNIK